MSELEKDYTPDSSENAEEVEAFEDFEIAADDAAAEETEAVEEVEAAEEEAAEEVEAVEEEAAEEVEAVDQQSQDNQEHDRRLGGLDDGARRIVRAGFLRNRRPQGLQVQPDSNRRHHQRTGKQGSRIAQIARLH